MVEDSQLKSHSGASLRLIAVMDHDVPEAGASLPGA